MTSKETAQSYMHSALEKFLDDNAAVYAGDKSFNAAIAAFKAKLSAEQSFGPLLATDNTAYSSEKSKLKTQMATQAAHLAGFAYVALNLAGKTKEAEQLDIRVSDYEHLSDVEAQNLAQSNLNLMQLQTGIISPDYVTAADLTDLDTIIKAFAAAKGTAESINKATPAQRAAFKAALADTDASIENLRLLVRKYLAGNKIFHDQLLAQATVVNVNIHHTSLSIAVTNKADGTAIANALASLSNSKKTGTSDAAGNISIEEIQFGTVVLTITAAGYKNYTQTLTINRGKENHVEAGMEKE